MRNECFFGLVLILILCCGCGNKIPLHGTITFSDDGSPLPMGTVCFAQGTFIARGEVDSQGNYEIGSDGKKDGIPQGTYQVFITGSFQNIGVDKNDMPISQSLIAKHYENAETSGLAFTVDRSKRRFDFQVDRFKKK